MIKRCKQHSTQAIGICAVDIIIITRTSLLLYSELRSRAKVEADVLASPSLIVLTVSLGVKQHWTWTYIVGPCRKQHSTQAIMWCGQAIMWCGQAIMWCGYEYTYQSIAWHQSSGAVWVSRWTSWAPVPNKPTVSVDVKQHFNIAWPRAQELCESRGGRPGLPSLINLRFLWT